MRTLFLFFLSLIIATSFALTLGAAVLLFCLHWTDVAQHPLVNLLLVPAAVVLWIILTCYSMWYLWGGPEADRRVREHLEKRRAKP